MPIFNDILVLQKRLNDKNYQFKLKQKIESSIHCYNKLFHTKNNPTGLFEGIGKNTQYVKTHGYIKRAECQKLLNVNEIQSRYILQKMKNKGLLKLEGIRKGARYILS